MPRMTGSRYFAEAMRGYGVTHIFYVNSIVREAMDEMNRVGVTRVVTHGEKDSQIPVKWAHRTYDQLVNSPKRELKIFTEREGGVQHSSFDNSINAGQYIADWVAEVLGGRTA